MSVRLPPCAACGGPRKCARAPTGLCRPCSARRTARDRGKRAKCRRRMRALYADPVARTKHVARTAAGMRRARAEDPAYAASRRESGRRLNRDGVEARLGWCPEAYRPLAIQLRKSKRLSAAEARRMVEAQIVLDRAHGRMDGAADRQATITLGIACAKLAARQQRESRG